MSWKIKNRILAAIFLALGVLSLFACDMDGTFLLFAIVVSVVAFFTDTDILGDSLDKVWESLTDDGKIELIDHIDLDKLRRVK